MTLERVHIGFKMELDKSNISSYPSFLPEEIDYFINLSIDRFYKTRLSGTNPQRTSFQQNQKRSDDFRNIIKAAVLSITKVGDTYSAEYPEDYWFMVGESVKVKSTDPSWPKDQAGQPKIKTVDVLESTIENVDSRLNNSLSDHRLNKATARPLRVFGPAGKIILYTDGNYSIEEYSISYISEPVHVNWYSTESGYSNESTKIESVPDHAWDEVISNAVRLALENISDARYQTYSSESQVIE